MMEPEEMGRAEKLIMDTLDIACCGEGNNAAINYLLVGWHYNETSDSSTLDEEGLYLKFRKACAMVALRFGIEPERFNFGMLISRVQVRNGLIRAEYEQRMAAADKGESEGIRRELARKYRVGEEYLNKILYGVKNEI